MRVYRYVSPSPSHFTLSQAYYSSFAVPFLDFDDEPGGGDESIDSLEDDQDIEGYDVIVSHVTCHVTIQIYSRKCIY